MSTIHHSFTKGQTSHSKNITRIIPVSAEKFVPTCKICGKKHWPLDPSCIGKKGVKAETMAKVKAAREAKAKAIAQAEEMVRQEDEARIRAEQAAKQQLDEKTRAYEEAIAKTKETLQPELLIFLQILL